MIHNFRSDIVRNLHAHVSQATRQGKLVLTFAVVFVIAVAAAVIAPLGFASSTEAPQQVEVRQVQPGDTLWQFAEEITPPGGDVRDSVNELEKLNDMDSSAVYPGQRLVIPIR
ncbi:LysM peptidoglycan-binding domain-containing protein [Pseudoscardovia suis]|uniref:LysM peptidoglycan-binding domain-containing protein n=1 Tax=Pseudoscardovia suis TaxID=987063 RepID=UPI003F99BB81